MSSHALKDKPISSSAERYSAAFKRYRKRSKASRLEILRKAGVILENGHQAGKRTQSK